MIGRKNRPEREISSRIDAVRNSGETSFRGLLAAGGFNLGADLRLQNLSGLSFAGEDLREIDLTGANLVRCDFTGARIAGARFDQARLGAANIGLVGYSRLDMAADWTPFLETWIKPLSDKLSTDDHLPPCAIFKDASHLPLLIRMESSFAHGAPIAISCLPICRWHVKLCDYYFDRTRVVEEDEGFENFSEAFDWQSAREFLRKVSEVTGLGYRFASKRELQRFHSAYPALVVNELRGLSAEECLSQTGLQSKLAKRSSEWCIDNGDGQLMPGRGAAQSEGSVKKRTATGLLRIVREMRSGWRQNGN